MLLCLFQKYSESYSWGSWAFVMLEVRRAGESTKKGFFFSFATRREREGEASMLEVSPCWRLAQRKSCTFGCWVCHCCTGCLPFLYSLSVPKSSVQLLAQGTVMLMKERAGSCHASWSCRRQRLSEIGDFDCRSLKTEALGSPYRRELLSLLWERVLVSCRTVVGLRQGGAFTLSCIKR